MILYRTIPLHQIAIRRVTCLLWTSWRHVSASTATMDLADMGVQYSTTTDNFDVSDLVSTNPIDQFEEWFKYANNKMPYDANAMALSTANKEGMPSVRMVLLKGFDQQGFQFFTNYTSRKGKELEENQHCSLMLYWPMIHRSVRIEGKAVKMSREESIAYYHKRPKDSQIAAACSYQSIPIPDKKFMDKIFDELQEKYANNKNLPCPDFWGGYRVVPTFIEFWHGALSRRHDRIRFRRLQPGEVIDKTVTHEGSDGWVYERLGP